MYEFKVSGMTCGSCVRSLTKAISKVAPEANVEVNLSTQTVQVKSEKSQQEISSIIEQTGYPVMDKK